jgi:hypothetical protein
MQGCTTPHKCEKLHILWTRDGVVSSEREREREYGHMLPETRRAH